MMRSSSSSSCNSTSLTKRLETIFKKAYELSILCGIEVSVIHYGSDGELKTWSEERETLKDMAIRYKEAKKRKRSFNLHEFVDQKKKKMNLKYPDWFDHYSLHQLSQLSQSLERTLSVLQESFLRVVEARNTDLVYNHGDQNHFLMQQDQLYDFGQDIGFYSCI